MVSRHTVNCHPSPLQFISRIHSLIFLWIPKEFISPVFIVLRLVANTFASQKFESVHFYSCPQEKPSRRFWLLPPRQKKITHYSQIGYSEDLFFPSRKGGEDYGVEKITKIKPTRVVVTSFDKFHHLCNLYIFRFCFVVP